jgi:hypothetical protein
MIVLPPRVSERIVAVERTEESPITRSVACMPPWRELNFAVGGSGAFERRKRLFFTAWPSRTICTRFCVGNRVARGSSDQEPACSFSIRSVCRRSLNIPWITCRFVYIYRPLTGALNGAAVCLFPDRETALLGTIEYAGGPSPGPGGYVDRLLETKGPCYVVNSPSCGYRACLLWAELVRSSRGSFQVTCGRDNGSLFKLRRTSCYDLHSQVLYDCAARP